MYASLWSLRALINKSSNNKGLNGIAERIIDLKRV